MMRKENGITLIALVITIIVMLILVGVTITMAINGGLFTYASNAAKGTNEQKELEQELSSGNTKLNVDGSEVDTDINKIVDHYVNGTSL